jgi:AcrR family transcriptional regulator
MEIVLHRKIKLVITTIDIIDELGIQGLSTREIAKREGVSEATLFRHYKSKNELLIAVLEFFSQFDVDIYQTTRLKQLEPKESIRFFINAYAEYYENYPAITTILELFDILRRETELADTVKMIRNRRTGFIIQLIEDAKKSGEIDPNSDSENIADMITGFTREICLKWRMCDCGFALRDKILSALDILLGNIDRKYGET